MYCPQWCYFVFPPPPPVFDIAGPSSDGDDSSGPAFSPLVIAIIGVLASAFLLVSYYTIVSKYCGTFSSLRNRVFGSGAGGGGGGGHGHGDSRGHDPWDVAPPDGMDETLINKITVCKYKRGDGFVDSTDCSVCLGEFRDGESLRLLPKCSHAFHLPCIDTWLKSHSNCPLCRCNIAYVAVGMVSPEPEGRSATREDRRGNHEFVLTIDDDSSGQAREEPQAVLSSNGGGNQDAKDRPGRSEAANGVVEIREDGTAPPVPARVPSSLSDTHREARMSIADVLQESLEDELTVARESGHLQAGSSRRCHGEHSKDGGGAAPTKKLPSAGRSCFSGKSGGRGKDSVPPM
jgi:hypothetical protein